ncbi:MAG: DUF4112 domain-containing protein [Candidatus Kapaibacteriota bacterium]
MAPLRQTSVTPTSSPIISDQLQPVRRIARVLDDLIRIPGTNIGIGIDPLLNLIPVAGDAAGTVMSAYLLVTAVKMGVPKRILARMVLNISIDALVGVIPFVGQAFDFIWKANNKNMVLLERYATNPSGTTKSSGIAVMVILVSLALVLVGTIAFAYWLLTLLSSWLNLPLW